MTTALFLLGGLVLLFLAGEILVRGSVLLALRLGVSPLMIGLTVVGFGTSMPELVTSLQAAFAGAPGIAIGNIVGSNIANVLLIIGIAALVSPIPCPTRSVMRDGGIMVAAALALAALTMGGVLTRTDGAILVLGLAVYLVLVWHQERRKVQGPADGAGDDAPKAGAIAVAREIGLVLAGFAGLVVGGRLLVDGAVDLAQTAGVSDTVIGLTVVAIGTSLPELATSFVAAMRKQSDIAYGNIVGSNVFNVLGIAGVTALTHPIAVPAEVVRFDIPVMIGVMLLMTVFAATGARLSRSEGAVLLGGYAAYLLVVV
ncbi:calcium/sodium antiporter [Microbaculum sp. FT89]|uniref:calcium/sodium antiporter n=1 Tax=Microbaculum sp. FT89 TaxID=3447298 RepID=UPI003F537BAB